MSKLSIIGIIILVIALSVFASRKFMHMFGHGLKGNGISTTEDRPVSDFTKLQLDGVFKTIITQDGGAPSVKVEADENLQKIIILKNDGETLTVGNKSGVRLNSISKMTVYVNVKNLSSLVIGSVGAVENKGILKSPDLYFKTEAVGKTILNLDVDKLTADLNSVGAIELSGRAATAEIDNNSVGKLKAYNLKTETLNFKNNAVGAAEVYASRELSIDHNGVGAVHYKGTAVVKEVNDNGVGKVSKAD